MGPPLRRCGGRYRLWIDGSGSFHVDPRTFRASSCPSASSRPSGARSVSGVSPLCSASSVARIIRSMRRRLRSTERRFCSLHPDIPGRRLWRQASPRPAIASSRRTSRASASRRRRYSSPAPRCCASAATSPDRLELPGASEVAAGDDRVHYSLDRTKPRRLPAAARFGRSCCCAWLISGITLERVSAADALRELWPLSFRLPTLEDRARCFQGVTALADAVPVWNLYRPFRLDLLGDVVQKVVADA